MRPFAMGLDAPGSWVMTNVPSASADSHTQPEPKRLTPFDSKSVLKASILPHCLMICAARAPVGSWAASLTARNCLKYSSWLSI